MNEQIEKLVRQAEAAYIPRYDMWQMDSETVEKFAELIVKECANFVDYRLTNPNGASMAWCDGSDIKEHFGVEDV
jgi:hypothetical protein